MCDFKITHEESKLASAHFRHLFYITDEYVLDFDSGHIDDCLRELTDWCEENFGPENTHRWSTGHASVFIHADSDAVLFKLRWM